MKLLRTILLLSTLFAMTGCFSEDYSICPPERNITLHFSLADRNGKDIFADHITTVDVMVFDEQGTHLSTQRIDETELKGFQGTHLALEPGKYSIVCWGNVFDRVLVKEAETANNPTITYKDVIAGKVGSIDKVYYSGSVSLRQAGATRAKEIPETLEITIPESGTVDAVAKFSSAHREIKIFIKGATDNEGNPILPDAEMTGVPLSLCYFSGTKPTDGGTADSHHTTKKINKDDGTYAYASLTTFWFDIEDTIYINIYNPITGEPIVSLPLQETVKIDEDGERTVLTIVLEFKGGEIEIQFPDWSSGDIDWGHNE